MGARRHKHDHRGWGLEAFGGPAVGQAGPPGARVEGGGRPGRPREAHTTFLQELVGAYPELPELPEVPELARLARLARAFAELLSPARGQRHQAHRLAHRHPAAHLPHLHGFANVSSSTARR